MAQWPHQGADDGLVGATIGDRYRVESELGRGGMGVVYMGVHEELRRRVAIKVLSPVLCTDPNGVERLLREARTAGQLGHPNIVAIHDLGRLDDGRPFLVMPLLEGRDLAELLETEGPQSPQRVVRLLEGVAEALELMHTKGLVHRDIKPENLMVVRRDDGAESVMILDFGLASMIASNERLTREGSVCGTPEYMAPEAGGGDMPDARGDIYSLGVVAFELLTGALPFCGPSSIQILTKKMLEPAPSLASVSDRGFAPELERAIAKALAMSPDERFGSAVEFLHALRGAADVEASGGLSRGLITKPMTGADLSNDAIEQAQEAGDHRRWAMVGVLAMVGCVLVAWMWTGQQQDPWWTGRSTALVPPAPPDHGPSRPVIDTPVETSPVPAEKRTRTVRKRPTIARAGPRSKSKATEPAVDTPSAPTAKDAARLTDEAMTAFVKGRFLSALTLFRQATRSDSTHPPAWRGLGLASEKLGKSMEAIDAYRRYLSLEPSAPDASTIRARLSELQSQTK